MKTRQRQPDATVLSLWWGVLWGVALGMWILAPPILNEHHMYVESLGQRVVVMLVLAAIFALLGGFLVLVSGFGLAVIEAVAGTFADRRWAYALAGGPLLIIAYSLDSVLVHWATFRNVDSVWSLTGVATGAAAAVFVVIKAYTWMTRRDRQVSTTRFAYGLAGAAVVGAIVAAATAPRLPPLQTVQALKPLPGVDDSPPLLFVGIDGASWRVLRPEIENGSAPTLRRLLEHGAHGTMEALWPPHWSGAAWGAILTGLPREVTGVYEDLVATAPGLPPFQLPMASSFLLGPVYSLRSFLMAVDLIEPSIHSRSMINGTPVWEWLHSAGVDTAVVRFRFTYPPAGRASLVISDRIGYDGWERLGVPRDPVVDAVTPADRAAELLAPFTPQTPPNRSLFDQLLPEQDRVRPRDSFRDPIEELQIAADIDERTFDASERIVERNPAQPFLGVYIAGLDAVEHAFWQYRFPDDYSEDRPDAVDVARLKDVLPRYVRYLDRRLGSLLAHYKQPPNIVIVSDHGFGPTTSSTDWRGWHAKEAIVVAAGPSIPPQATSLRVSYYDVVPTLLALRGLDRPASLRGRSFVPGPGPGSD